MKIKLILVALAFMSMVGCTSTQTLESGSADLANQIEAGDHLIIHEKSGATVEMVLGSVDGDVLKGTLAKEPATEVTINVADVEKIEKKTLDGVKTVAVAAGGAGLLYILLAVAVFLTW